MAEHNAMHRTPVQRWGLWLGLALFALFLLSPQLGWETDPARPRLQAMAAALALIAVWWITEALPIAVTSLAPLILFPLLKIPPGSLIAREYGNPLIYLFLGGFLLALAIEDSGLHRRAALHIVALVGDNPRGVVLGFMISAALLSMWLSNTATTLMLFPLATVVLQQADEAGMEEERRRRFGVSIMLGLAYAASIGGMATIVGTPPNLVFKAYYDKYYAHAEPVSFFDWMLVGVPLSLIFLALAWVLLTHVLFRLDKSSYIGGRSVVREQLAKLGPVQPAEWRMLGIFAATALLWILREPSPGFGWGPLVGMGTSDATGDAKWADDGTIAILMATLCFIIPSGKNDGTHLLEWSAAKRVPWGVLLLFGGGLALGAGMKATELDQFVGEKLESILGSLSQAAIVALTASATVLLSEVTSNLACINMLLPILKGVCDGLELDARRILMAATFAASCGFMLPVATAPNAIVYASGRIRMWDFLVAGFWLDVIGVALVVLFFGF